MTKGAFDKCEITRSSTFGNFLQDWYLETVWENIRDFESLSETLRFTRVCEGASFVHWVSVERSYKTRPDEDDGFGQIIPWCREHTLSRVNSRSRVFAAIPGGTIFGPINEVQILKILDQYGHEIATPSPHDSTRTSYVLISRGKSRFVDEIHVPNAELWSSAELLSELQKAEGREPCLAPSKTSIQETGAVHDSSHTSIKETCAHTLSVSPCQASFFTQNRSYDREEVESYSCQVIAWRSSANSGLQNGYKKGASLRSRWTTTRRSTSLGDDKDGTAESVRRTWSTRFLRSTVASTYSRRKQQDKIRVLWGFSTFLGLLPSNSRTLGWNSNRSWVDGIRSDSLQLERVYFITGVVLSASNPSRRTVSFQVERKAREDDRPSSSHHLILLVEVPMKKNTVMITQFLKKCTITAVGNAIKIPFTG